VLRDRPGRPLRLLRVVPAGSLPAVSFPLRLHLAAPTHHRSLGLVLPLAHRLLDLCHLFLRGPLLLLTGYDWAVIAGGHSLAREVPATPASLPPTAKTRRITPLLAILPNRIALT
jgi:hypothetical protein